MWTRWLRLGKALLNGRNRTSCIFPAGQSPVGVFLQPKKITDVQYVCMYVECCGYSGTCYTVVLKAYFLGLVGQTILKVLRPVSFSNLLRLNREKEGKKKKKIKNKKQRVNINEEGSGEIKRRSFCNPWSPPSL